LSRVHKQGFWWGFCFVFVVRGMEPRALSVLGKCSTTEYPNTQNRFLMAGKTLA
jgi:hypothetical protein